MTYHSRTAKRAGRLARRYPLDPPLWTSYDTLGVCAAALVAIAVAIAVGWLP